jgi:ketosteroid isomerase-like protein
MKMLALVSFPLLVVGLAMALTMTPQTNSISLADGQGAGGALIAKSATASSPALQAKAPSAALTQADGQQVLRDTEAKFAAAVASKDSQAFLAFWAEDAAIFPPGEPVVVGKEKILAEWAPILTDSNVSLTWSPDKAEMAGSGDLGYTYGKYLWSGKGADGQPAHRHGKYVTIWRKGLDSAWRVVVDLGTPSDPPAPAKPAP